MNKISVMLDKNGMRCPQCGRTFPYKGSGKPLAHRCPVQAVDTPDRPYVTLIPSTDSEVFGVRPSEIAKYMPLSSHELLLLGTYRALAPDGPRRVDLLGFATSEDPTGPDEAFAVYRPLGEDQQWLVLPLNLFRARFKLVYSNAEGP